MKEYLDSLGIEARNKGYLYLVEAFELANRGVVPGPAMLLEIAEKHGVRYMIVRKALCRVCDMIAARELNMQGLDCKDPFLFMERLFLVVRGTYKNPDFL